MNVAEKASVSSAIRASVEKYSAPPSLVANAAGITRDNFLLQMDESSFMEVLDVNVKVFVQRSFYSDMEMVGL